MNLNFQQSGVNTQAAAAQNSAAAMSVDPAEESIYIAGNEGEIELQVGEPIVVKSGLIEHHEY